MSAIIFIQYIIDNDLYPIKDWIFILRYNRRITLGYTPIYNYFTHESECTSEQERSGEMYDVIPG